MKITDNGSATYPTYFASENGGAGARAQLTAHYYPTQDYSLSITAIACGAEGYSIPHTIDAATREKLLRGALDIALDAEARLKDLVEAVKAEIHSERPQDAREEVTQ